MRYGGKLLQHVKKCDRAASSIDLHRTGVTELSYSHNGCTNQDLWLQHVVQSVTTMDAPTLSNTDVFVAGVVGS